MQRTNLRAISGCPKVKSFLEIKGPKSIPIFGSLFNYIPPFGKFDPLRLHVAGRLKYDLYGSLVREEILPGINYLFLYDPIDIEAMFRNDAKYPSRRSHTALEKIRKVDLGKEHNSAGLLPTSGTDWYKMRINFQQALAKDNIQHLISKGDQVVSDFCQDVILNSAYSNSTEKDFLPFLMRLSLELTGQNFFGTRIGNKKYDPYTSDPDKLIRAAEEINSAVARTDMGFQMWRWIDTPTYSKIKRNIVYIERTADHYINLHKSDKKIRSGGSILGIWLQNEGLDPKDLVTMSADMILAGIDTTSFTLGFLLYHLASNTKHQDLLYAELRSILPNIDSPITTETLKAATFLKRCVKESLRLNPISVGVGRIVQSENLEIAGYHIPIDTVLVTMNQVSCRLPKYFHQPNSFQPERWEPANKQTNLVHPFLILPFGFGVRGCIGRRLAEQQIYMITAKIFRQFILEWIGKPTIDSIGMINRPDSPLRFAFLKRPD